MELKKIFKYRNVWIGAAMLWIVFFHAGFWVGSPVLSAFKKVGYGGVDICLFASGIGCYFSLEKDPDSLRFLQRRLKRLAPAYFCFMIPWLIWKRTTSVMPIKAIVGNLLGIQTLATWEYHFNWYISGLVVYYILMPYLKKITDSWRCIWQDIFTGVFLVAVSINFWEAGDNVLIFTRLPVLYAGVVFGKLSKQGYALKGKDLFLLGVAVAAGIGILWIGYTRFSDILWTRGLHWYPFALIVPGSCVFLSLLAARMDQYRPLRRINKFLDFVGTYSFELYLFHVFLYENLMPDIMERIPGIPNNQLWLMTLPVVVCGTYLLNRAAFFVGRICEKKIKKA